MPMKTEYRRRYPVDHSKDICVTNINSETTIDNILKYFSRFGAILQHNQTRNGIFFIKFETTAIVDHCLASRPHFFGDRKLCVKRALPHDEEHPLERIELTEELMIVINFDYAPLDNETFLKQVKEFFSTYGQINECRYEFADCFKYILLKFDDHDVVDRIILAKPHYYCEYQLEVMKHIESNITLTNKKFSMNESSKSSINVPRHNEMINGEEISTEIFRLQKLIQEINVDYERKRQTLEDDCNEQIKALEESTQKTRQLHDDLLENYKKLLKEFKEIEEENGQLNEQYLMTELENFELTSLYEQNRR